MSQIGTVTISEEQLKMAIALSKPIDVLNLDARCYNALRRWKIDSVGELCDAYVKKRLPRIRNLGEKSIIEIEHMIELYFERVLG